MTPSSQTIGSPGNPGRFTFSIAEAFEKKAEYVVGLISSYEVQPVLLLHDAVRKRSSTGLVWVALGASSAAAERAHTACALGADKIVEAF